MSQSAHSATPHTKSLASQSTPSAFNLENHLLIALPSMPDVRFKQSVIYICEHDADGAMGFIINKPMNDLNIAQLLAQLELITQDELENTQVHASKNSKLVKPVMYGGPVAEDQGFVLHTAVTGFQMSKSVSNKIMMTSSKDILGTLGTTNQPDEYLVILGYASWEANQLEREIMDNGWLTVEATPELLFHTPIFERWEMSAKMLGVDIRQVSIQKGHA